MNRKVIGTSLVVAGLLAGSFLAGGLLLSGSSKATGATQPGATGNIVTPTATATKPATPAPKITLTPTVTPSPVPDAEDGSAPTGSITNPTGGSSNSNGGSAGGGTQVGGNAGGGNTGEAPQQPAPQPPVITPTLPPAPEPPVEEPEAPAEEPEAPAEEPEAPGDEPETPAEVNEAPFVVESSPANGATKVSVGTSIVVTFSEPMDTASVEAAFSVQPATAGSFEWNADGTVMTFTPNADFTYNILVKWQIDGSAADAAGLAMGETFSGSFNVLYQKTITLHSLPDRDGYAGYAGLPPGGPFPVVIPNANTLLVGLQTRGFLSFDLAELPAGSQIIGAELIIQQRDHSAGVYGPATGSLWITSVPYGTLDLGDYSAPAVEICWPACAAVSYLLSDNAADGVKTADVTKFVQRDWENSKGNGGGFALPGGEKLTQLRLQFQKENINLPGVWAEFQAGESGSPPKLNVTVRY